MDELEKAAELNFGQAIRAIKRGRAVAREGWNGKGQCIRLQNVDPQSYMSLPYIYIQTVQGHRVPWLASQTDMLANDWKLV